ncbi:MAG: hypothetical protein M3N32_03675 [Actinomycetota bacterium]|nr:hypothetical protein [Actinomycetota bacterium]
MAHIQDLREKTVDGRRVRTSRYGTGNRWQARYLDPDGRERTCTFERRQDAERFLVTVRADVLQGAYVDPDAGKVTFAEFTERWRSPPRPLTRARGLCHRASIDGARDEILLTERAAR